MRLILLAASLLFVSFIPIQRSTAADIVFKNGNIYTCHFRNLLFYSKSGYGQFFQFNCDF